MSMPVRDLLLEQALELAADQRHLDLDLELDDLRRAGAGRHQRDRPVDAARLARGVDPAGCRPVGVGPLLDLRSARVVSPANFLANDGSPSVRWTWSLVKQEPLAERSTATFADTTSWAALTFSRKAGSASISNTADGAGVVEVLVSEAHVAILAQRPADVATARGVARVVCPHRGS